MRLALGLAATLAPCAAEEPEEVPRACEEPVGTGAEALDRICDCTYATWRWETPEDCFANGCLCPQGGEDCDEALACIVALDEDDALCDGVWACMTAACRATCEAGFRRIYECCMQPVPETLPDWTACCLDAACAGDCAEAAAADCGTILAAGCPER